MRSLKYIFFFFLALIIGASVYVATLDGSYNISVSRAMKAPAEVIFKNVNNYKNWELWNPWQELDKTTVTSYPEQTSGIGASFTWTGIGGLGSVKTISTTPNQAIIQEIDLRKERKSEMYWELLKFNDSTKVTWGIRGNNNFSEKINWLLKGDVEIDIAQKLTRGLELLNEAVLKEMDVYSIDYKGVVDYGGGYYLYQTVACKNEDAPIKMTKMFSAITNYMTTNQLSASGKPFTLNHQIDIVNETVLFSACVPVRERIITEGDVLTSYLEPVTAYKIIFKGNYKFLPASWPNFYKNLENDGHMPVEKGQSFEVYTINPNDNLNPAEWLTEIYIPIKTDEVLEDTTIQNQPPVLNK